MKYYNVLSIGREIWSGKLFLDSFFSYSENQKEKYELKLEVSKNQLWETNDDESSKISNCKVDLGKTLSCMEIRSRYNNFSICCFTTDYKSSRKDFEALVDCANYNEDTLQKINDAIIVGHKFSLEKKC